MIKSVCLFFIFTLTLSSTSIANRRIYSINDAWLFSRNTSISPENIEPDSWEKIAIPHTFNAQDGYVKKDYFRGTCCYRKEFDLNPTDSDKSIYLSFEGVLSHAQVFLNGKFIGEHKGGYTAFGFEISKNALFGQKNILQVKVNNENEDIAPLHGDFTAWGGIYRDVKLIFTEKTHFAAAPYGNSGVMIRTPQINEKCGAISVTATITNQATIRKNTLVKCVIRNKANKQVAVQLLKVDLEGQETKTVILDKLTVANPDLWSPDAPNLYIAETTILDAKTNQVVDNLTNNIGFRWFKFDGEKGFFLNGKHLKLIGVNRHQDFDGLGSALTDDFHRRDVQIMKDMGVNFLRIAHYPQDNALLEECDKQGIICWEEIPIVDIVSFNEAYYQNCETNLKEMIYQHYNHPSIMVWGFMNEIFLWVNKTVPVDKRESYYKYTASIAQRLDSVAHKIDYTRPTTIALHIDSAYERSGLCKITDVVGWNVYKGWYGDVTSDFCTFMDAQHAAFPNRPLIVSEYGAGSDRRIHTTNGHSFDFSMEYQQQFHEAYLPYILQRDYIAGSTVWNMNDFGSADRDESMPRINNKGLLYYNREPKDVYFYYKSVLNQKPVVHIATRDWFLRTGVSVNDSNPQVSQSVKVYSNQRKVELFVNGQSFGIKEMSNCNAIWSVPFVEGKNTLVAKSVGDIKTIEDATSVEFKLLPADLSAFKGKSLELAVNCGSNCDFTDDKSKMTWLADRPYQKGSFGYIGGEIYKSKPWVIGFIDQIQGTRNGPLFQTIRLGATAYQFDMPDGEYEVELSFTEPNKANQKIVPIENVFDVVVNGKVVLPAFNIAQNGGRLFAITKKIATKAVAQGGIKVELKAIKGTTIISGIKICKLD